MKRLSTFLRTSGMVGFLGIASLALSLPAHAGGLHVSIGVGLPFPVAVVPAPVVVAPAPPVVVQPVPVVVAPPPVVVAEPRVVRARWLPLGIAKQYYGDHPKHWKHHRHHDD